MQHAGLEQKSLREWPVLDVVHTVKENGFNYDKCAHALWPGSVLADSQLVERLQHRAVLFAHCL